MKPIYSPAMSILTIKHVTTYRYRRPVAFGQHRLMLRPRDDYDQRVIEAALDITPAPSRLTWSLDGFGNHVGVAVFEERAAELRFVANLRVAHAPAGLHPDEIAAHARTFPFSYGDEGRAALAPFLTPLAEPGELDAWVARFPRQGGAADTRAFLTALTEGIDDGFRHVTRHEKGTQSPARTLALGSGSCRDLAMLMIAALRSRGIAARFVSGYLHLADNDNEQEGLPGGNMHAWLQAYIPGPGWVDFDPSRGMIGNRDLVRVAVADEPHEVIPLQGTWIGAASDHLAMDVAVRVKAAARS